MIVEDKVQETFEVYKAILGLRHLSDVSCLNHNRFKLEIHKLFFDHLKYISEAMTNVHCF